jgi:hypothetical protein
MSGCLKKACSITLIEIEKKGKLREKKGSSQRSPTIEKPKSSNENKND